MDAIRWERIQTLFHQAVTLPPAQRSDFLDEHCSDDSGLADEVLALLEEDARVSSPLDRELADIAGALLAPGPLPLRQIGPYQLLTLLGEGGMGVVYLAERADLGHRVAIKMLRDAALSPLRRERFAREQRTLARLAHPGIARLYDAATLPDGTPYIVMEYVPGVSLTAYCREHACTVSERLRLFRKVCEAVHFAHGHAIVHRDLKPSNVLVTEDGEVKLLDFGISKQLDDDETGFDATRTGLRLMTPAYAAPEQIRGEPVGTYTDVYALGVMLYELLTGQLPFELTHASPAAASARVLEVEPERPSIVVRRAASGPAPGGSRPARAVGAAAWADLDVLCLTAMQKDPQRRYRTAEALLRDIDHYLRGQPLDARPDTARYRLGKFLRRNWRPVSAVGLALALLVALTTFYTVRLTAARDRARAEAARTARIQSFMLDLLQAGDETTAPADTLRVVDLLGRGVRNARALDREPAVQADLYYTLGGMYQKLGHLARADSLFQAALERRRTLFGPRSPEVGRTLVALGRLRVDQARLPDAERLVRRGYELERASLPARDPNVLRAQTSLGEVLQERGSYDEAIRVLQRAAGLQLASDTETADWAATVKQLADAHFYAGSYAASDSLNRILLAFDRRHFGARHPHVADDLIDLGAVRFQLGDYAAAERYYRQALAINLPYYGGDHPEIASDLTMLARALVYEGGHDGEARELLDRALSIQQRVHGPVHPAVASVLNDLGALALKQDSLASAAGYFTRMADIYRKVYGGKHYLLGIALANLASTYLEARQYTRAEPVFRQAITVFEATLPADHLNVGVARIKLGRTLLREHRFAEAERESLAGYDIVARQSSPGVSWLRAARKDLVAEYDSLDQPQQAARFRAQLADTLTRTPASAPAR